MCSCTYSGVLSLNLSYFFSSSVPSLNLGHDDEDQDAMKEYNPYNYNLKSPATASTVR